MNFKHQGSHLQDFQTFFFKQARCVPFFSCHRPPRFPHAAAPRPLFPRRALTVSKSQVEDVHFTKTQEAVSRPTGWLTFWGALDAGAWLGALGTAAAFLITQEAMLAAAPVALPLLALYASKQRERLAAEAAQAELAQRSQQLLQSVSQLARGAAGEAAATEMARAVELQQQAKHTSEQTLKALEAKLAAVEGSVLSTGGVTRESLREAATSQGRTAQELFVRLEALGAAVRRDVALEVRQSGSEELALLARLEGRLAALEGAIKSLEGAQQETQRQLPAALASALEGAEANLEEAVRWEAQRSLEPLRRLPQLLAEAMPIIPEVLPPDRQQASEEGLREMISQQLGLATRAILEQQASLLQEVRDQPQLVAPAQWNQLGSRLVSLQQEVKQLLAAQEAAAEANMLAAQQAQQALTPALPSELAAQLEALRADVAVLSVSVAALTQRGMDATSAGSGDEEGRWAAGGEGATGVGALTAQQAQQAGQLAEMVLLLKALAGRLEEVGAQVSAAVAQQAQRAQQDAVTQEGPPPESGAPSVASGVSSSGEEEGGAGGGAARSREEAYSRMQALLASKPTQAGPPFSAEPAQAPQEGRGEEVEGGGAVPISQWLSGAVQSSTAAPSTAGVPGGMSDTWSNGGGVGGGGWSRRGAYGEAQPAAESLGTPPSETLAGGVSEGGEPGEGRSQLSPFAEDLPAAGDGRNGVSEGVESSGSGVEVGVGVLKGGVSSADRSFPFIQGQIEYGAALGVDPGGGAGVQDGRGMEQGGDAAEGPAWDRGQGGSGSEVPVEQTAEVTAGTAAMWDSAQSEARQAQRTAGPAAPSWQQMDQPEPADASEGWQQQQQEVQGAVQAWGAAGELQPLTADSMESGYRDLYAGAAGAQNLQDSPADGAVDPAPAPGPLSWDGAGAGSWESPEIPFDSSGGFPTEPAVQAGGGYSYASLEGLPFEALCERGRQRLREGRAMAAEPGVDLGLVDSLFWEAEDCLEAALKLQPDDLKALGNLGNALMAHGRLRLQMLRLLPPEVRAEPADRATADAGVPAGTRLEEEALSLLLLAGRKYKRVLELDDSQERAMVNWGRCVCLRAEVAKGRAQLQEAADLFSLAADKFDAALDLNRQNGQALRLAGMALLDMALCLLSSDRRQAKQLLKDAQDYLASAVAVDSEDQLSQQKVAECKEWLDHLRGSK